MFFFKIASLFIIIEVEKRLMKNVVGHRDNLRDKHCLSVIASYIGSSLLSWQRFVPSLFNSTPFTALLAIR